MKIFLQRVKQAGASNSRSALFILITAIFAFGALVQPTLSKSFSARKPSPRVTQNSGTAQKPASIAPAIPATPSPCASPPSGLVSWWPAEGNTNDIVSHNNGTWLSGGPAYDVGEVGQAFSFNGADEVRIGDPANLRLTSALTIDAWINPTSLPGNGALMAVVSKWAQQAGTGADSYSLWVQNNGGTLQLFCGVHLNNGTTFPEPIITGGSIPLNSFSHVAMTFDSASGIFAIYVNGSQVNSANVGQFPILTSSAEIAIGHEVSGQPRYFNGDIDEVEIFNRALGDTEIAAIYNAGTSGKCHSCTPPPSSLIGWWPSDGNTKDIQSGNTGQLKNGTTFGTGEVAKAFQFDGTDDYVFVSDDPSLHYNDFTYDAWIAPDADSPVGDNYIICKGEVGYYEPLIAISGSAGAHYWHVFVDNVSLNGPNVTYNFQHVAVTRQGTTAKLYVDGVLYDTQTVSSANSADGYDLEFGNIPGFSSSAFFKGRIDEVEIFNRALSDGEIQSIYDAGSLGKCKPECTPPPSGLAHWWPGDNTATDIQGNNNGTLKNGATFGNGKVDGAFSFDGT